MGHKKDMGHTDKLTYHMKRDLLQEFPFGLVCLRRDFSGSQKLTSGKKEKRNPDICVCAILCANACKCVEMRAKCVLNACNNACKMRVNACDNDTKIMTRIEEEKNTNATRLSISSNFERLLATNAVKNKSANDIIDNYLSTVNATNLS